MIHSASIPLQVFKHDCQLNQSVCPNAHVNRDPARLSAGEKGACHLICQHDGLLKKTPFKRLIFPLCLQASIKKIRTTVTKFTATLTRINETSPYFFKLQVEYSQTGVMVLFLA